MKEIKLTQNKVALVDDEDYEYIKQWKWYADRHNYTWYAARGGGGRPKVYLHTAIMKPPEGLITDHKDGNGLNCQQDNMKNTTQSKNRQKGNTWDNSYRGVSLHKTTNKFIVQMRVRGKQLYLGLFTDKNEAAQAYNISALTHFGKDARLNIII